MLSPVGRPEVLDHCKSPQAMTEVPTAMETQHGQAASQAKAFESTPSAPSVLHFVSTSTFLPVEAADDEQNGCRTEQSQTGMSLQWVCHGAGGSLSFGGQLPCFRRLAVEMCSAVLNVSGRDAALRCAACRHWKNFAWLVQRWEARPRALHSHCMILGAFVE